MAGLNLMDMITAASGGQVQQQLGSQLGLDDAQTASALKALLPALSAGLQANTRKPGGVQALLGALANGDHGQYLDDPSRLTRPETIEDGNAILGHLLGSREMSRSVASAAAQKTGISDTILKAALPMIASMVMGSLSKQTQDPDIAGQLMGMLGGGAPQPSQPAKTGFGLNDLLSAATGARAEAEPAKTGAMGMLGRLLDSDGDGSAVDDIFQMVMKQRG